jgi:hypothetical protein
MPVAGDFDMPAPGALVPDWPMSVPDFAFPVAPVPAGGIVDCVGAPG